MCSHAGISTDVPTAAVMGHSAWLFAASGGKVQLDFVEFFPFI